MLKKIILLFMITVPTTIISAQVKMNYNNSEKINKKVQVNKNYPSTASDITVPDLTNASSNRFESIIEINPYYRYDTYVEFLSEVRPLGNYFVKLQGNSFGLNLNYKIPLKKRFKFLAGIGYYQNRFDKIIGRNRRGQDDHRLIAILPPPPIFLPYFTDKYWYHCLSLNIGVENDFKVSENYLITVGAIFQNNFTFSQYYQLTNNPLGGLDYKRKQSRYNGFSVLANVGVKRRKGKFYFGPQLILPVFDKLTFDEVFPKETSEGNPPSKWFRGVGVGFSCNYSLTKKKIIK